MTLPKSASNKTDGPTPRPLRADAQRNRARILQAAEAVFASVGASAATDDIARQAGVGVGTLFRHFPTKESLLEAIVLARVRRLVQEVEVLVAEGDPASAFFTFFVHAVEQGAEKKTFTDLLAGGIVPLHVVDSALRQQLRRGIQTLLSRAQGAGTVRNDVNLAEVLPLLVGAGHAVEFAGDDHLLRNRILKIILDGFCPPETSA